MHTPGIKSTSLLGKHPNSGFSLLEILLVISLIAVLFTMALPNLGFISTTEAAQKLGTLSGDIRAAYDMAVLHQRPHRLAFHFASGDYWLETTDREDFRLGAEGIDRDLSPEELEERVEYFEEDFEQYEELAGEEVEDIENEVTIPPVSPVVKAKERLQPAKWQKVEDAEWSKRSLGPYYAVLAMQAEHHIRRLTLDEFGDRGFAYLYFFPSGYVERAVIYIGEPNAGLEDLDNPPYTLVTEPYEGIANVDSGYREVDIFDDRQR